MSLVKTRDTEPELALRRALHRRGFRYRVHVQPEPSVRSVADLVFRGPRLVVFVDGCFWHGCPDHATWPKANAAWWKAKIERNRVRDRDTDAALTAAGWVVERVWEHELVEAAVSRIANVLNARRVTHISAHCST
jgi:DNA mismatch endonuclease (patch repair protein)